MKMKNIALLLFLSMVPVAVQAMEDNERLISRFNEDIRNLTFGQFIENIKKGSLGERAATQLTEITNAKYQRDREKRVVFDSFENRVMTIINDLTKETAADKNVFYVPNEKISHIKGKYSKRDLLDAIDLIQGTIKDSHNILMRYVQQRRATINK